MKYVIPCQSQFSRVSIDQLVIRQYESISATVKSCLRDHRMSTTDDRAKQGFSALKCLMKECYSKPVPLKLLKRVKRERKVVRNIKRLLRHRPDIVIRRTDDFERKTEEYMSKTDVYQEVTTGRCPLADITLGVQTLLNYLFSKNAYMHGPTTLLSKFLNDLLAPIFLKVARHTTFINGIDLVRKLEKYVANGHLSATTKFITADVTDLYTMIPRQGALEAPSQFCVKHSLNGKIGTLTICLVGNERCVEETRMSLLVRIVRDEDIR